MKFLSTKELAGKWGVDQSRVLQLAYAGRIEGAAHVGNQWMFPSDTKKPGDGRTRKAKALKDAGVVFRFPLYVNFEEKDYCPALSEEERTLRNAQNAFQACRFPEAKDLLLSLSDAENRYVRLSSFYHLLYIAILDNSPDYDALFWKMNAEFSQDFPYKNEMLLLRYGFDADCTSYKSVLEEFAIDSDYSYHPSAFSTLALVSLLPIQNGDFSLMSRLRYDTYELVCQKLEHEGYYLEAQKLHFLLLVVYQLQNNEAKMETHIRHGMQLALDHNLYFVPAFYERWYRNPTLKVLRSFPKDFADTIHSQGKMIQEKWSRFQKAHQNSTYLSNLSSKEFEYAFLANQGYTNREIALKKKVSEKTVSRIYGTIYEKLGVKTRQELVNQINNTHKNGG